VEVEMGIKEYLGKCPDYVYWGREFVDDKLKRSI